MSLLSRVLAASLAVTLVVAGAVGTLATIMGFFSSAWWMFDLIVNFRVLLMLGLLIVAMVYGMIFGKFGAIIFLAAAVLNLLTILPFYLGGQPAPTAAADDDIRITAHNVTASNQNRNAVLEHFEGTGADLIFVFESSVDWESAVLASDLDYEIIALPDPERRFGTMVLASPELTVDLENVYIGEAIDTITKLTVGDTVVFGLHPRSPTDARGSELRDEMIAAVTDLVSFETGPTIVVGDLNATPWSHSVRSLQDEAEMRNSLQGFGLQPTWHSDWRLFSIPIDHVLMTQDLTTVSRATGPANGSDHLPITVTVSPVG